MLTLIMRNVPTSPATSSGRTRIQMSTWLVTVLSELRLLEEYPVFLSRCGKETPKLLRAGPPLPPVPYVIILVK